MIPRKLNQSRNAVGRGPPIFRYRFYPLAHRARWIDKAAKSRRITGIVPEKRRCHGRWYKGRGPVDRRQRDEEICFTQRPISRPTRDISPFNFSFCALEARFLRLFLRQPTRARGERVALSMTTQREMLV